MFRLRHGATALSFAAALANPAAPAQASNYKVLYAFQGYYHGPDGGFPYGELINVGGTLYGVTISGGVGSNGTVYAVNPQTGAEQVVYAFKGGNDGSGPVGGLINVNGTLFGATQDGGAFSSGTVFAIELSTGVERVVYSFKGGSDGAGPVGSLIRVGNALFGTTTYGGVTGANCPTNSCGTVFSVNIATNKEHVLHVFQSVGDGTYPAAGLIYAHGLFYGTTEQGGTGTCSRGCGTVFAVDQKTGSPACAKSSWSPRCASPPSGRSATRMARGRPIRPSWKPRAT